MIATAIPHATDIGSAPRGVTWLSKRCLIVSIEHELEQMKTDQNPIEAQVKSGAAHAGSLRRVMAAREFRLLLAGSSASLLGDQFALIATPWLVLQISADPFALGLVLALEGLPRAGSMLIGGAVTDRFAPRRVMVGADIARAALTAAMAFVVLSDATQMWMIYGYALCFGLFSGLAIPAENSIVPSLVERNDLEAGNALKMTAAQLAGFAGPALAGIVIASYSTSLLGIGLAYGFDALTFIVSAAAVGAIQRGGRGHGDVLDAKLWESIAEGIRNTWEDEALRFVFSVLIAVNLFVVGPLLVGIPLLAHQRLSEGALAFGVLMGSFAVGNLGGYLLAGVTRKPSSAAMRLVVLAVLSGFGVVVASLGVAANLWIDAVLLAGLGLGNGYLAINLFTWIQARTPEAMLGRTMSLVTFTSLGLVSISQAAAGMVSRWSLDALFLTAGALVVATAIWSAGRPGLRIFADSLTANRLPKPEEQLP